MILNPNKSIISIIIIIIISVVWSGSIKALHSFLHCQPSQQCNQLIFRIIRNVILALEKKQEIQCKMIINHIDLRWYLDASCFNLILLHSIRNVVCIKHMMCSVNCSQNSVSVREEGCVGSDESSSLLFTTWCEVEVLLFCWLWIQMNTGPKCPPWPGTVACGILRFIAEMFITKLRYNWGWHSAQFIG